MRQFFLDRVHASLLQLKALTVQLENGGEGTKEEPFLTECFDAALELLAPFCEFVEAVDNVAQRNASAMVDCAKIQSLLEFIVAQTLSFANVLENQNALMQMCQRVLRESKDLQSECALGDCRAPNEVDRRLKANVLESAIYALENLINDSLLRLLFETFADLKKVSLQSMRNEPDCEGAKQDLIDATIDRLTHITLFAVNFSSDFKTTSSLKSSMASIEALDSHVCAELIIKYDIHHFQLLEQLWTEETQRLQTNVQKIIETSSFSAAFQEICEEAISDLNANFKEQVAETLISKAEVLVAHFQLNYPNEQDKFQDFNVMVKECKAGLKILKTEGLDPKKLLKRFKILKTTVKRVRESLKFVSAVAVEENKNANEMQHKIDTKEFPILRIIESGDEEVLLEPKRLKARTLIDPTISWKASMILRESKKGLSRSK